MDLEIKTITSEVLKDIIFEISNTIPSHKLKSSNSIDQINNQVSNIVRKNNFASHILFDVSKKGTTIHLKNLVIIINNEDFYNDEHYGFSIRNRNTTLDIKNSKFVNENNKKVDIRIIFTKKRERKLLLSNCDLGVLDLTIENCSEFVASDCVEEVSQIDINNTCHTLSIENSVIGECRLPYSLESLHVVGSKIHKLNIDSALFKNPMSSLQFDDSEIVGSDNEKKFQTYKKLRILAKQSKLKDKIQEHVLYTKELDSYVSSNNKKLSDDYILFMLNDLVNKHGRSFVRPVILMLLINFVFMLLFNFSVAELDILDNCEVIRKSLWMLFDLSPLSAYEYYKLSDEMTSLDSLRRILLAILTYSTISATLRFKFKT